MLLQPSLPQQNVPCIYAHCVQALLSICTHACVYLPLSVSLVLLLSCAGTVTLSMARDLPVMVEYRISDMGHLRSVQAVCRISSWSSVPVSAYGTCLRPLLADLVSAPVGSVQQWDDGQPVATNHLHRPVTKPSVCLVAD